VPREEQFAFWRYDLFPYFLGSPIDKILDNGLVRAKAYGGGTFRPVLIVPHKDGVRILEGLQKLTNEYASASVRLHDGFMNEVHSLMGIKG
jgi:hypothetical protein